MRPHAAGLGAAATWEAGVAPAGEGLRRRPCDQVVRLHKPVNESKDARGYQAVRICSWYLKFGVKRGSLHNKEGGEGRTLKSSYGRTHF